MYEIIINKANYNVITIIRLIKSTANNVSTISIQYKLTHGLTRSFRFLYLRNLKATLKRIYLEFLAILIISFNEWK